MELNIFHILLVTIRVGGALMPMLGISLMSMPMQFRFFFALGCAFYISQIVEPPATDLVPAELLLNEIIAGAFFGFLGMAVLKSLSIAGNIIASQSSLALSTTFDQTSKQNDSSIATFLSVAGVMIIMISGAPVIFIGALIKSYEIIPYGSLASMDWLALSNISLSFFSNAFELALRLASPFIIYSLSFYFSAGILNKLAPQMQVFFIALPLQILLAMSLLALTFGFLLQWFLEYYMQIMT